MLQPCRVCLPAVSVPTLFLHVFCCAMLQGEKAAIEGGAVYETVVISLRYSISAIAGAVILCRTMTPAEFDRP